MTNGRGTCNDIQRALKLCLKLLNTTTQRKCCVIVSCSKPSGLAGIKPLREISAKISVILPYRIADFEAVVSDSGTGDFAAQDGDFVQLEGLSLIKSPKRPLENSSILPSSKKIKASPIIPQDSPASNSSPSGKKTSSSDKSSPAAVASLSPTFQNFQPSNAKALLAAQRSNAVNISQSKNSPSPTGMTTTFVSPSSMPGSSNMSQAPQFNIQQPTFQVNQQYANMQQQQQHLQQQQKLLQQQQQQNNQFNQSQNAQLRAQSLSNSRASSPMVNSNTPMAQSQSMSRNSQMNNHNNMSAQNNGNLSQNNLSNMSNVQMNVNHMQNISQSQTPNMTSADIQQQKLLHLAQEKMQQQATNQQFQTYLQQQAASNAQSQMQNFQTFNNSQQILQNQKQQFEQHLERNNMALSNNSIGPGMIQNGNMQKAMGQHNMNGMQQQNNIAQAQGIALGFNNTAAMMQQQRPVFNAQTIAPNSAIWNGNLTWTSNPNTVQKMEMNCAVTAHSVRQVTASDLMVNIWPANISLNQLKIKFTPAAVEMFASKDLIPLVEFRPSPQHISQYNNLVQQLGLAQLCVVIPFNINDGIIIVQRNQKLVGFLFIGNAPIDQAVKKIQEISNPNPLNSGLNNGMMQGVQAQVQQQQQMLRNGMLGGQFNGQSNLTPQQIMQLQQMNRR